MSDKDILVGVLRDKLQGVMYHSDFMNFAYMFGLKGTFRFHKYVMEKELETFHKIERYIMSHHHVIPDTHADFKSFNPNSLVGRHIDRLDIKCSETKTILSMITGTHLEWEKMTKKKLYEAMEAVECEEAELFLQEIYLDVCDEILEAEKRMMWYNNIDWDMPTIMEHQKKLHDEYKHKK